MWIVDDSTVRHTPSAVVEESLPLGFYELQVDKRDNPYLTKIPKLKVKKLYGDAKRHLDYLTNRFDKGLPVSILLLGDKGTGKSLLASCLCDYASKTKPIILVNKNNKSIVEFIRDCIRNCVIVIDEFEKVFPNNNEDELEGATQNSFLSILDGISENTNSYILTINDQRCCSPYLLGRPGRIKYLIKFSSITSHADVVEYLEDFLSDMSKEDIGTLASSILSAYSSVTYDQLAVICEELQLGTSLNDALEYLNIQYSSTSNKIFRVSYDKKIWGELDNIPASMIKNKVDAGGGRFVYTIEEDIVSMDDILITSCDDYIELYPERFTRKGNKIDYDIEYVIAKNNSPSLLIRSIKEIPNAY